MADDEFRYLSGFGNEFATEAVDGALPRHRNSPQQAPLGLYAEQISGTAFTQPRAVNRRTWVYRQLPSAADPALARRGHGHLPSPPLPLPAAPVDFIDGLYAIGGNGDPMTQAGIGIHWYCANRPMVDRYFVDA